MLAVRPKTRPVSSAALPDVEKGKVAGGGVDRAAVVVVDDVVDLLPAPVHDPVVAVEGQLVPAAHVTEIDWVPGFSDEAALGFPILASKS